ncbi:MAG: alpha/beta hydrolase [Proteobacteria bacterium]|nr:alpha/beta hydrolase [Pseudomonadota bacterium]
MSLVPYRHDLIAARMRIAREHQYAPMCSTEYAVVGYGLPILVVHGSGGGIDQSLLMAADLVRHGYRVIAPSRFGYLGTPLPNEDASSQAQADAFACLLDHLKIDRVAVIGASAGAPSSMQMAIRHPERVSALVLLVPATFMPNAEGAGASAPPGLATILVTVMRWDYPFWVATKVMRKILVRHVLATPPELLDAVDADERQRVENFLDFVMPVSERRVGLVNDGIVTTNLSRFALEQVRAPTLVISAQDDLYGTYERARYTAGEIPGARFVGYPSGGHLLVGHQKQVTNELLTHLGKAIARPP